MIRVLFFIGLALEVSCFYAWIAREAIYPALILHLLSSTSFYFWTWRLIKSNEKYFRLNPVFLFGWGLIAFFPGFGLLAALLFIGVFKRFSDKLKQGLFEEFQKYLAEKRYQGMFKLNLSDVFNKLRTEIGFEPFIDIMQGEEVKIKLRAIEKLSKNICAENIRLLKEAFNDRSADVRLYAAATLVKIDSSINKQIELASMRVDSRAQAADFKALGELYFKYLESGLVEKQLRDYYLNLCAESYRSCLDIETDQPDVVVNYARCIFALKQHHRAKDLLDAALRIWPQNMEILFLRNELYFTLGDFRSVRDGFREFNPQGLDIGKKEVYEFWINNR